VALTAPVVALKPLTNAAYGFPTRGHLRRVVPTFIACIHITGNGRVAANRDLHAAALSERSYANRAASPGPSAHEYTSRDARGWLVQAIDWKRFAAWSNGDVSRPNLANPLIAAGIAAKRRGYNLNEFFAVEVENVGYGSTWPLMRAQLDADAYVFAQAARKWHLPINRTTIIGHWEINGVDRQGCPCSPALHNTMLDYAVAATKRWYAQLYPVVVVPAPTPVPVPAPAVEEYPVIEAIDRTPKLITVAEGKSLYDLNGKAVVTVSNTAERLSPGGVATGRMVFATWGGSTKLVIAKTADIVKTVDIPTAEAALAKAEALQTKITKAQQDLAA
jgi:hypothetical protein